MLPLFGEGIEFHRQFCLGIHLEGPHGNHCHFFEPRYYLFVQTCHSLSVLNRQEDDSVRSWHGPQNSRDSVGQTSGKSNDPVDGQTTASRAVARRGTRWRSSIEPTIPGRYFFCWKLSSVLASRSRTGADTRISPRAA